MVELIIGNLKFYTANMYLDITEKLDKGTRQRLAQAVYLQFSTTNIVLKILVLWNFFTMGHTDPSM